MFTVSEHLKCFVTDNSDKPFVFLSSDTRKFTHRGGPAAGGAAVRAESHHSVHDSLSAQKSEAETVCRYRETRRHEDGDI